MSWRSEGLSETLLETFFAKDVNLEVNKLSSVLRMEEVLISRRRVGEPGGAEPVVI